MFTLLLACYFAFTLIVAGLAKVDNPYTFAATLRATHLLPDYSIPPLSKIIPWSEIILALLLISGIMAAPAAATNLALLAGFLGFKVFVSRRNLLADCGCFGGTYRRKIDKVSVTVSIVQVGLAALYLWAVSHSEPINSMIHLVVFMIFIGFACLLCWRIAQRRNLQSKMM